MRLVIVLLVILSSIPVGASHLDYMSGRKWIEQQCLTSKLPQEERIFLGRFEPPTFAAIIRYHKGITLREVMDQTALRGKTVYVSVMRLDHLRTGPFTRYEEIKVGPSDAPGYELKTLDVVWFFNDGIRIEK